MRSVLLVFLEFNQYIGKLYYTQINFISNGLETKFLCTPSNYAVLIKIISLGQNKRVKQLSTNFHELLQLKFKHCGGKKSFNVNNTKTKKLKKKQTMQMTQLQC